jgi:fructosamine-3-kinase
MDLSDALEAALGERPAGLQRIGGGSINQAFRADLPSGERLFVKTRPDAPEHEFASEAAGLRWLAEPAAIRIPAVRAQGDDFLALEWVDDQARSDPEELGRGLAAMHQAGAQAHGELPPGAPPPAELRLAGLTLPSTPSPHWPSFYAEQRLAPLVRDARDAGSLSAAGAQAVESVCDRIADLAGPPEPPARLHGDLWGGNVLGAALVDPAAYGGHREVDLAMLRLFGGPGPRAFAAYDEAHPLAPGHEERVALWQLFPLLVHAVLFGGGYGSQVERAARSLA